MNHHSTFGQTEFLCLLIVCFILSHSLYHFEIDVQSSRTISDNDVHRELDGSFSFIKLFDTRIAFVGFGRQMFST